MGELLEILKEKYSKSTNETTKELMNKQRVKNSILSVCDILDDSDDTLTFEVSKQDLPYAVSVVVEEPLKSKYNINQISETLFVAQLKEIDL